MYKQILGERFLCNHLQPLSPVVMSKNTYYLFLLRFTSVNLEVLFLKIKASLYIVVQFVQLQLHSETGSANLWPVLAKLASHGLIARIYLSYLLSTALQIAVRRTESLDG